jgi:hypothetical protein
VNQSESQVEVPDLARSSLAILIVACPEANIHNTSRQKKTAGLSLAAAGYKLTTLMGAWRDAVTCQLSCRY